MVRLIKFENPVAKLNRKVGEIGIPKAMEDWLSSVGVKVKVKKSRKTSKIMATKPVLVLANHPSEADVPVLLSVLPQRKDFYLIANSSFTNIIKNIDPQIIPVHINHRLYSCKGFDLLKLKLLRMVNRTEFLSEKDAHRKNVESVNLAAQKVRERCMVAMYPAAGNKDGVWFSGVGYLIKNICPKEKTYIVLAHIKGTSNKDYLRIIPGVSRLLPQLEIDFAKPIEIEPLLSLEAKQIAQSLELQYRAWVEQKENKIEKREWWERKGFMLPKNAYLLLRTLVLWISVRLG